MPTNCVATLEDRLYGTKDELKDPAFVDKKARFVEAVGFRGLNTYVDFNFKVDYVGT